MPGAYHSSGDVFDQAHSWQFRVLLAAFPHDPMGSVVRAVLGKWMRQGMAHGRTAVIAPDGMVRTAVRDQHGRWWKNMPVGGIIALRDEFRRLADHCRLADAERNALFEELRKWIAEDQRSESGLDIRAHN